MGAFVDTSKVAVSDDANTIYIKRRMDFGTKCRVEDTLTQMALKNGEVGSIHFTLGAQKLALAIHNIIGWIGPDFAGTPCTPENIERLDPDYPLLLKVQARITELNTSKEDLSPLDDTRDGGTPTPASTPPLAAGMST